MFPSSVHRFGPQLKLLMATVLLAVQVAAIAYARVTPKRYFCWAPNDYVTEYTLKVVVNNHQLTDREILTRYRLPEPIGVYGNPAEHIIDAIQQYETTYGSHDLANVELSWTLNGRGPNKTWVWPAMGN